MAFVKTVKIVYVKGITDPFTLIALVKKHLGRDELRAFNNSNSDGSIQSYDDLITLCTKYVELDDTKDVGTEPEFGARRDVYDDKIVPFRKLLWETAEWLARSVQVAGIWTIKIGERHSDISLWLSSMEREGVTSPSVTLETGRGSWSGTAHVKIRCHPGLAMNATFEKATPQKIGMKLIEHGEKAIDKMKVRAEQESDQVAKQNKARRLINQIELKYKLPRYYQGSNTLELSTGGVTLRVTPTDYGSASVSLSLSIGGNLGIEQLEPIVTLINSIKEKNDYEAAKAALKLKEVVK